MVIVTRGRHPLGLEDAEEAVLASPHRARRRRGSRGRAAGRRARTAAPSRSPPPTRTHVTGSLGRANGRPSGPTMSTVSCAAQPGQPAGALARGRRRRSRPCRRTTRRLLHPVDRERPAQQHRGVLAAHRRAPRSGPAGTARRCPGPASVSDVVGAHPAQRERPRRDLDRRSSRLRRPGRLRGPDSAFGPAAARRGARAPQAYSCSERTPISPGEQRLDALHGGPEPLHGRDARDARAHRSGADLVAVEPRARRRTAC